jgi:hypothetical protein
MPKVDSARLFMTERAYLDAEMISKDLVNSKPNEEITPNEIRLAYNLPYNRGTMILEILERKYGFIRTGRSTLGVPASLPSSPDSPS